MHNKKGFHSLLWPATLFIAIYWKYTVCDYVDIAVSSFTDDVEEAVGFTKLNGTALTYTSSEVTSHRGLYITFLDRCACRVIHQFILRTSNTTQCGELYDEIFDFLPDELIMLLSGTQRLGAYRECVSMLMEQLDEHSTISTICPNEIQNDHNNKAISIIAISDNYTECAVRDGQSSLSYSLPLPDDRDECCAHEDNWGTWSVCTWYKSGEKQLRYRTTSPEVEWRECEDYVRAGEWTRFGEWSSCSESCGEGFQTQRRTCFGWHHGAARVVCDGSPTSTKPCTGYTCIDDEFIIPEETFTAADERSSAKTSGTIAIIFITILVVLIVLSDVTTFKIQYPVMARNLRYAFSRPGVRENKWRVQLQWRKLRLFLGHKPRLHTYSSGFDFASMKYGKLA